ncbi:RNA-binding domain-containing protein [Mycoplasmopsis felifaucium]|uniref:RNA-binding domain-containing protein n=1 Tax=Mycoplasmopsis felifaucium TaxID=35768 RepID=UPI00048A3161|nr:RNA-binding domain-containing protein [Mycoplasmopsis felifaucium]
MDKYIELIKKLKNEEFETEWYELKENWFEPYQIGEYISALSNSAAVCRKDFAYLIWGISDKTHEVVGTTFDYRINVKNEPLQLYLARQLNPDIVFNFEEVIYEDKKLVVLEIPKAKNIPTSFDSVRYLRIGSSKVNLYKYPERESKLFEILNNSKLTIENIESEYQDLTFERLFTYYAGRGISLKSETFKKNLGLITKNGKYNLMAQLLSDNSHISIRLSIFSGNTKASALYSVKELGNTCILLSLDKALEYADVINIIQADETNRIVSRKDISLFDANAFREAIINAFVHNKWVDGNAPMITVYSDRIEILSRGTIDPKQTLEGFYLGESIPVNQKLSDIFLQLHISERSGRGVPKIIDAYGKNAFDIRENSIVVTLPFKRIGKVKTENNESKEVSLLSPRRVQIINEIKNKPNITQPELSNILGISLTAIENNIKYLRENGHIQRIGSNKNGYWKIIK